MVGLALTGEQRGPVDLALGIQLAVLALVVVGQPRGHGAGGQEHRGQVTEGQRTHEQAGHNLVAHPQKHRGIKEVVRQGDARRHGDDLAREERQLHAGAALGDAIAHRWHSTSHLGGGAHGPCGSLDLLRVAFKGLVGAEHVVVSGDDAQVGRHFSHQVGLVSAAGRVAVGQVAARQPPATGPVGDGLLHPGQVGGAGVGRARLDAGGDFGQDGMQCSGTQESVSGRERSVKTVMGT